MAGILEIPVGRTQLLGRAGAFAPTTVRRAYLTRGSKVPPSSAAAFRWVGSRSQQISALARSAGRLLAADPIDASAVAPALIALQATSRALAGALTSRRQPAPLAAALDPGTAAAWKAALLAVAQIAGRAQPSHWYLVRLSAVTADLAAAARVLADVHATREQREQTTRWRAWCQEALQGGASAAHRYVRPPEAIRVGTARQDDGTPSASPAELLRADHGKWSAVWAASSAPPTARI